MKFTIKQVAWLRQRLTEMPVYVAAQRSPSGGATFHGLAMKREDVADMLKQLTNEADS